MLWSTRPTRSTSGLGCPTPLLRQSFERARSFIMKTVADLVRGWLAKGDSDLAEASRCAQSAGPYDTGCFHCQQAVEKYAKAVFDLRGQLPPRTHDLGRLLTALQAIESSLAALARPEVVQLTDYA